MAKFKRTLLNHVTIHEKVPFRINLLWLGYVSSVYCLLVQFVDFIILSLSHPVYTCLYIFFEPFVCRCLYHAHQCIISYTHSQK